MSGQSSLPVYVLLPFRPSSSQARFYVCGCTGSFYAVDYMLNAAASDIYKDIYKNVYGFKVLLTGLCNLPRRAGIITDGYCNGRMTEHNYKVVARKHNWPIDRVAGDDLYDFPIDLLAAAAAITCSLYRLQRYLLMVGLWIGMATFQSFLFSIYLGGLEYLFPHS
ncbi:hypothetical protein BDV29DRAFT_159989 [Aspergillus leporis]|uniref:Uncharacterized protein n=1 Tax=Aspergillus leporis TaxID=41062 RepID=A0A5N5WR17_9EURO|nr:hypothetical protein BDV29DRAFT_159989 [Aspergillus leporis]